MHASTFDLFKIGIGPSSSHTMGPMTAAADFVERLAQRGQLDRVARVATALFGSLALTGKGHATDRAVILGLSGARPATLDPDDAVALVACVRDSGTLRMAGIHTIAFDEARDLHFLQRERLPFHSNAMRFAAFDGAGAEIASHTAYSVGGGAVVDEEAVHRNAPPGGRLDLPHPFSSGDQLVAGAVSAGLTIAELVRANERAALSDAEISARLAEIRRVMAGCIDRGVASGGPCPAASTSAVARPASMPSWSRAPGARRQARSPPTR